MRSLPRNQPRDSPGLAALESGLRLQFSGEIEAQRDNLPDPGLMLLMSELESSRRQRTWNGRFVKWVGALALGAVAAVAAFWFPDAAAGIETLLPAAVVEASGNSGPGLAGGLFGASLYLLRSLIEAR